MTLPGDKHPEPIRCPNCGKYMEKQVEKERLVVYYCCGVEKTRFKPEFRVPPEEYADVTTF